MKKLFICLILAIFVGTLSFSTISVYAEQTEYVKVITDTTKVYTTADTTLSEEDNPTKKLNFGEEFLLIQENIVGNNDIKFVKVNVDDFGDGYIIQTHIIKSSNYSLKKNLDTNAKVNKDDTVFYSYNGENFVPTEVLLSTESKVKLVDGYDKSKTYLKAMVDVNGEIEVGYIKTEDILVSGVSLETIIAIIIFGFCAIVGGITIYKIVKSRNSERE